LYFHRDRERLSFASEIRTLLRLLPRQPDPDPVGIVHWLAASRLPAGTTVYEGVGELLGGEHFELSRTGLVRGTHWAPEYKEPTEISSTEAAELLWDELSNAVTLRMQADERVAIVMSSGIDSSLVAATAAERARQAGAHAHGFSAVFPEYPDPRVDETARTGELAAALNLPVTLVAVQPKGALSLSLDWLETWKLPLLGPGYILERRMLELAADERTTGVLDGQWGDELLGAAANYLPADLLRRGRIVSSISLSARLPEDDGSWRGRLEQWHSYALDPLMPPGLERALARLRKPTRQAPTYLTKESAEIYVSTRDFSDWKRRKGVPRWWAEKAELATRTRQASGLGGYLRHRAALAGLRARPPFFDVGLIELTLRLPPELDFDRTFDRPVARQSMAGRVPDNVRLSRTKSDLTQFYRDVLWRSDIDLIRSLVLAPDAEILRYVRADGLERVFDASGPGSHVPLWRLVSAECWLRYQSDGRIVDRLRGEGLSQPQAVVHQS
jgi:asparagine synthase (glutamine-hydrolysing)